MANGLVLHVTSSLERAGAELQMVSVAQGAAAAGRAVHVCALDHGGSLGDDLARAGVRVTVLGRRWQGDPTGLGRWIRLAKQLRPEVIHSWRPSTHAWAYLAARWASIPRFIITQHRAERAGGLGRAAQRLTTHRAAAIVVNAASDVERHARAGWPRERIIAIPNGVPPVQVTTSRGQLLGELGLPPTVRLLASAGRLREQKRLKDAVWATDLLQVIRDDVHLLLLGTGPHYERLRKFSHQANVAGRVHFLGERRDAVSILAAVDVYWSTSGEDGHPRGLLEAMSAGVPVVATDLPGTREIVVPGETGFLVPVGDRAGFARHTNRLLDDAALAARLGENGRARVERQFSAAAMVERYLALYR